MKRGERERLLIDTMYTGTTTIEEFKWDNLTTVPLLSLVTQADISYLHKLILSPRYSGNNKLKIKKMDEIMHFRGFTKYAGGTNRIVYIHPSAPNAVFKVAIDSVGINDNPAEYRNQFKLKPYCCKVFECSSCGTIASFEKVNRISTFEEFYSISEMYYDLLVKHIIGKYVMEDIGIKYFMNIGIRKGFGAVVLDFPYLFELDGAKLQCSAEFDNYSKCGGEVDYDAGFNQLICTRCGRKYRARDLAKAPENGGVIVYKKGRDRMIIRVMCGDECIKYIDTCKETTYVDPSRDRLAATKYEQSTSINRVGPRSTVKWSDDDCAISEPNSELNCKSTDENKSDDNIDQVSKHDTLNNSESTEVCQTNSNVDHKAVTDNCVDLPSDNIVCQLELTSNQELSQTDEQRIMMIRNSSKKKSIRNLLL